MVGLCHVVFESHRVAMASALWSVLSRNVLVVGTEKAPQTAQKIANGALISGGKSPAITGLELAQKYSKEVLLIQLLEQ